MFLCPPLNSSHLLFTFHCLSRDEDEDGRAAFQFQHKQTLRSDPHHTVITDYNLLRLIPGKNHLHQLSWFCFRPRVRVGGTLRRMSNKL